jgi:hypothetical protein
MTDTIKKCVCSGCKEPVAFVVQKLWGKGGTIYTCARHKPGNNPGPEHLRPARSFYDVKPISADKEG